LISITPSPKLLFQSGFNAALIPASRLLDPLFPRTEAINRLCALGCSLICFGTAQLLPGCFLAGCDEYLKEPWSPEELEWRVRKLCKGREEPLSFSWGSFDIRSMELNSPAGSCALCAQERSILRLLAANRGEPVSREALYYGIWGRSAAKESRVADMHIASLRRKLRRLFPESGQCIRSVRGVGYLIVK
jgi:hypothetical protein